MQASLSLTLWHVGAVSRVPCSSPIGRFLHNRELVHGALSSRMVFVHEDYHAQLGVGRIFVEGATSSAPATKHNLQWLAPEVVLGGAYGNATDVYSYSVVLWELFQPETAARSADVYDKAQFGTAAVAMESVQQHKQWQVLP